MDEGASEAACQIAVQRLEELAIEGGRVKPRRVLLDSDDRPRAPELIHTVEAAPGKAWEVIPDCDVDLVKKGGNMPESFQGALWLLHDVEDTLGVPAQFADEVARADHGAMAHGVAPSRMLHQGLGELDVLFEPGMLPVQPEPLDFLPGEGAVLAEDVAR